MKIVDISSCPTYHMIW